MKKIFFLAALVAMFGGLANAQDTLYRDTPLSNYYCTFWPDTTDIGFGFHDYSYGRITAKRFVTQDTLTVYGIAAAVLTYILFDDCPCRPAPFWLEDTAKYMKEHYPEDPTFDHLEESLLLYQYSGNASSRMQLIGDSLPVHTIDTPVSYYMQTNVYGCPTTEGDTCYKSPLPVYERYFTIPQNVHDTFYTGFTRNCMGFYHDTTDSWTAKHLEVYVPVFGKPGGAPNPPGDYHVAVYRQYAHGAPASWEYRTTSGGVVYFIFPILTPKPEEEPGEGPVAVSGMAEWDRYVSLSPNPAKERVEVISSFGMSSVKVYDDGGREVHEQQVSGHKAVLDVHGWPAGTYLLRITTPMGTTTKKLLVR